MQKNNSSVLMASNLADVFFHIKSVSNLQILGGCTYIKQLKEKSLCVKFIDELSMIEKRERYIDFGPSLTLSQIIQIKRANLPAVLYDSLTTIASESVRNLATFGGSICACDPKIMIWSPLLALDARLEFRNQNETKYIPFTKYTGVPKGMLLTKIRIPIEDWDVQIFRRTGPSSFLNDFSAGFTFLASTQKDLITNTHITFAGNTVFRSTELENKIIGAHIPLTSRFIVDVVKTAQSLIEKNEECSKMKPILKQQFLNLIQYSLEQFT
ncbi:FAD binding domain-containing protein [Treponema sp.]|uniref:FAD binding domain-containing protein n=1 Tax=Treponema sp. TaxID=166 RepID=UPI0025E05BCA|nr:FAD binding domain-containing protein [Treponema sp.]MCR5217338.1 FAD binding domain-containing protein [Treponema sp.]